MDVLGLGVLLTGKSGIGKSEVALDLINRGHRLIADDAVDFHTNDDEQLVGTCPPLLQDFLEVRGLGILNIRVLFGDTAIKESKRLQLIINIFALAQADLIALDRLHGMHSTRTILGQAVAEVAIPLAPGRSFAVLIECAVRNQILRLTGYDASEEFIKRQRDTVNQA